jgi:hypothetical protein
MLSRIFPDPTDDLIVEFRSLVQAVSNNTPGVLKEIMPTYRQEKLLRRNSGALPASIGVLNCRGPLLNRAIHRFGAKIGFALHFQLTQKLLPLTGRATTLWYTNFQAVQGDIPDEMLRQLGNPTTLMQGHWEVGDQFRYKSAGTANGSMSAHFAAFRQSFALCAFAAEDGNDVLPPECVSHAKSFQPGWLKDPGQ